MRPRFILIGLLATLILAFIVLSVVDGLLVDLLWFDSLGYREVFTTTILAELSIFAAVWLVTFGALALSGMIALRFSRERERLRVVRRPDDVVEVNLPEMIRSLGERVPWRLIVLGGAALLALFAAQGESASWDVYLKAIKGVPFGLKEPAFGRDVGFYVFTLPLLEGTARSLHARAVLHGGAHRSDLLGARRARLSRITAQHYARVRRASVGAGWIFLHRARAELLDQPLRTDCCTPTASSSACATLTTFCGSRVCGCWWRCRLRRRQSALPTCASAACGCR